MAFQRVAEGRAFVQRQVRYDAAGHARPRGVGGEAFQSVLQEGIEVAHEHEARLEAPGPLFEPVHNPFEGDALFQRASGGVLDHRAVGDGIGEGDADFDYVRAAGVQFLDDAPERIECGEARGDEGNERRASGGVRVPYVLFKCRHGVFFSCVMPPAGRAPPCTR